MVSFKAFSLAGIVSTILCNTVAAVPVVDDKVLETRSSTYWVQNIARNGEVAFGTSGYDIYRDVTDYGADPSGLKDSTAAINAAIAAGSRCGNGCDSSTLTPAIVYFPAGTYLVSTPIQQYYYTQLIGDATNPPTLKASSGFVGMAVIDADPYTSTGANWYTNQNNFYRQIRNFVIDLTGMPQTAGAGIHWQVAQATSLQNIVFNMITGSASKQIGIFMDNGSGGFMSDLVFNGGNYGAFFGNQQFTTRNMTFNNCQTAIFMNWNWGWTLQGITINNCAIGLDMSNAPAAQTVGGVILLDSVIKGTPVGVKTAFTTGSTPVAAGTLILDNVDMTGATVAVQAYGGSTILAGGSVVKSWGQGRKYINDKGTTIQGKMNPPGKPAALLNAKGQFFTRSKPQYQTYPASSIISVKTFGAKGDGVTDDTKFIQKAMDSILTDQVLYFDHGAYVVSSTIVVPATIKITGEIWPMIMATGSYFGNQLKPQAVFKVGTSGQSGSVEMSDLIFTTKGPVPGAVMVEWNLKSAQGASGIWDCHWRIGGSAGTELQSTTCGKNPSTVHGAVAACEGAFLLFHATPKSAGVYLENTWLWVADHELDLSDHGQVDIYSGRGMLIESQGPTWLWGTAAEHSVLYQYEFRNAKNVFAGMIQTETPYYQSNPNSLTPFTVQVAAFDDPNFHLCKAQTSVAPCYKAHGLRLDGVTNFLLYGAGLYSWFENYVQDCVTTNNCQQNMIIVEGALTNINMYMVNTKAATNMVTLYNKAVALDADNRSNFCATLAIWTNRISC